MRGYIGKVIEGVKWLWSQGIELIYPPFCALCDETLNHGSQDILCDACKVTYPVLSEDLCVICSKPLQDKSKERCLDCRKRAHFYEEGKALWVYDEDVKAAIKAYKYHNRREIGLLFAKGLARYYNNHMDWPIDLVVPVPLHPKKLRQRGFSQTRLMAEGFCRETGSRLAISALSRVAQTEAQEGLSDKDRIKNVIDAFEGKPSVVKGKNVLLIDDVYTTGATIDGCAKALIDAGAIDIYFMTVAIGRGY